MNSNANHSPNGDSQRPDQRQQPATLTDAQRNFAKVVGQALAEAWRRQLQQDGGPDFSSGGVECQ